MEEKVRRLEEQLAQERAALPEAAAHQAEHGRIDTLMLFLSDNHVTPPNGRSVNSWVFFLRTSGFMQRVGGYNILLQ